MTWKDIIKEEPKQGPRISEEMFEEKYKKELEEMQKDMMDIAHTFKHNSKFLKDLMGKEGEEFQHNYRKVMDGMILALRSYGKFMKNRSSTHHSNIGGMFSARENMKRDERLKEVGKDFLDLADELSQAKK